MERTIYKPSTSLYDERNSVSSALEKYDEYISILSDEDLKREYKNARGAWLSSPTVSNIGMFKRAKTRMMEKGFIQSQSTQTAEKENGFELYK